MTRSAALVALASACLALAAAQSAPLPPPRPPGLGSAPPVPAPDPAPAAHERAPPSRAACLGRLQAAGHQAEAGAPPGPTQPGCEIEEPVRLRAVAGGAGRPVKLPDAPLIACALAEPLAGWIGRVVAPALEQRTGSALVAIRTGPGYECRTRNRQPGEKLSAHARGRAVDLAGFELASGRTLPVAGMAGPGVAPDAVAEPGGTLQALRISACGWFTTVLGPGADAFHASHLHLDLEQRGNGNSYRICR